MPKTRNFNDLAAKLPQEVRDRADARAREMRAEMLLSEIRKQQELTQVEVAAALGIKVSVRSTTSRRRPPRPPL